MFFPKLATDSPFLSRSTVGLSAQEYLRSCRPRVLVFCCSQVQNKTGGVQIRTALSIAQPPAFPALRPTGSASMPGIHLGRLVSSQTALAVFRCGQTEPRDRCPLELLTENQAA